MHVSMMRLKFRHQRTDEQGDSRSWIIGGNIQFRFLEHVDPGDSDDDGDAHRL